MLLFIGRLALGAAISVAMGLVLNKAAYMLSRRDVDKHKEAIQAQVRAREASGAREEKTVGTTKTDRLLERITIWVAAAWGQDIDDDDVAAFVVDNVPDIGIAIGPQLDDYIKAQLRRLDYEFRLHEHINAQHRKEEATS